MALSAAAYRPRDAERGVLHGVVADHLEAFLAAAAYHAGGARLPAFVQQEFRDFLTCGVLAHGFARLRCGDVFEVDRAKHIVWSYKTKHITHDADRLPNGTPSSSMGRTRTTTPR